MAAAPRLHRLPHHLFLPAATASWGRQAERSRYLDEKIRDFNGLVASVVSSVASSAVRLKSNAETRDSAVDLSQQAETLKRDVDGFIMSVRAG
jgi:hypothetical protein